MPQQIKQKSMWLKCPICNGTGRVAVEIYNTTNSNPTCTCTVCNGAKIISELTGLPPSSTPAPFKGLLQGIGGEKCKTCGHIVCLCNKTLM